MYHDKQIGATVTVWPMPGGEAKKRVVMRLLMPGVQQLITLMRARDADKTVQGYSITMHWEQVHPKPTIPFEIRLRRKPFSAAEKILTITPELSNSSRHLPGSFMEELLATFVEKLGEDSTVRVKDSASVDGVLKIDVEL